jgi:hypothetical protein
VPGLEKASGRPRVATDGSGPPQGRPADLLRRERGVGERRGRRPTWHTQAARALARRHRPARGRAVHAPATAAGEGGGRGLTLALKALSWPRVRGRLDLSRAMREMVVCPLEAGCTPKVPRRYPRCCPAWSGRSRSAAASPAAPGHSGSCTAPTPTASGGRAAGCAKPNSAVACRLDVCACAEWDI